MIRETRNFANDAGMRPTVVAKIERGDEEVAALGAIDVAKSTLEGRRH